MVLPKQICDIVGDAPYTCDSIGKSGSAVLCYADMVLKIEPVNPSFDGIVEMMRWLETRLPTPKVLCAMEENGMQYLLMSRVPGKMACDRTLMQEPEKLTEMLAQAIRMLWDTDISGCPKVHRLEDDLEEVRRRVENGLANMEDTEPETYGEGGFESPAHLLRWLEENRPEEDLALSHGDFCLPNVFFQDGQVSGYIDLGDTGISDRWRDVALCYRSLKHNFGGKYSAGIHEDFCPDVLLEKLGVEPNWEKIRYYILLDELF